MIGYKLFRKRADGSIGPLFINRKLRIETNKLMPAESHPTKGFAVRPGWHVTAKPEAPHLSMKGRQWFKVEFEDYQELRRPVQQGGLWYLANKMRVLEAV
jgi:hypothetical protein